MPDREKVIERIHEAIDMGVCVDLFMDALELLKEQEAVIRCKDCKYWNSNLGEYCEKINGYPGAEWFCANGERKEGR